RSSDLEQFPVGGSKTLRSSEDDAVTLIGAGVTLHEALTAADSLAEQGIKARVIDAYSIKPIDAEGIREAVAATGGRVVVAEDHHVEGGLGAAVLSALASEPINDLHVKHLAVDGVPGSGTTAELLGWAGIDAAHIAEAARAGLEGGGLPAPEHAHDREAPVVAPLRPRGPCFAAWVPAGPGSGRCRTFSPTARLRAVLRARRSTSVPVPGTT